MEAAAWRLPDHPPWPATHYPHQPCLSRTLFRCMYYFIQKKGHDALKWKKNTHPVTYSVTSLKTSVVTFLCVNILEQGLNNEQTMACRT